MKLAQRDQLLANAGVTVRPRRHVELGGPAGPDGRTSELLLNTVAAEKAKRERKGWTLESEWWPTAEKCLLVYLLPALPRASEPA